MIQVDPNTGLPIVTKDTKVVYGGGKNRGVDSISAGTNITVDSTDPAHPVISSAGGGESLPDQTGNSGKFLTTDGTDPSWDTPSGSGDMLAATYDPAAGAKQVAFADDLGTAAAEDVGAFAPALGADDNYVTDAEKTVIGNTSGTNSGDNATNSQYSGLGASKQDVLVSGTSIKTVNSTTLLGAGNLAVATSAQGTLADSAVQPGDLATVATSGAYSDLSGTPSLSGYEVSSNKATDFSTINDTLYPTVEAVQEAINTAVTGLLDYRGTYDASTNLFPATGGSGLLGAVLKGDFWIASVVGTLGGTAVTVGDLIIALVDTPGQTATNWDLVSNELGYAPEDSANKDTDGTLAANSDTKYASQKATKAYADTKQPLDSDLTTIAAANNGSVLAATTASFLTADETKLDGIEAGADVTDTANVTAAGALMDSEVDADLKTLSLPANTTITAFGASLIGGAADSDARTTLGLGSIALLSTITEANITLADNTTNNVSTSAHGFQKKLPNDATLFMDGAGDYVAFYARVRASGTSTSGTPGTTVADLQATAGKKLIGWEVLANQTSAASTGLTVTITYSDATTITDSTGAAAASQILGNAGGLIRSTAGAYVLLTAGLAKDVTRITVVTAGTGTGTRAAIISALEVA